MGGCFGSHPIDRWIESQVDAYCGSHEYRRSKLTAHDREQLENMGLDESDILEDMLDEVEDE